VWAYLDVNLTVPWTKRGRALISPWAYHELSVILPWARLDCTIIWAWYTVSLPWAYHELGVCVPHAHLERTVSWAWALWLKAERSAFVSSFGRVFLLFDRHFQIASMRRIHEAAVAYRFRFSFCQRTFSVSRVSQRVHCFSSGFRWETWRCSVQLLCWQVTEVLAFRYLDTTTAAISFYFTENRYELKNMYGALFRNRMK